MPADNIKLDDVNRILFGSISPEFLVEVFLRTLIIYTFFLLIMRLLGKRVKGQLTIGEFAVIITLGAIIAPSMQLPERGIVHALFILTCMLFFHRVVTGMESKSIKLENFTQGKLSLLVKDGLIQLDELKSCRISKMQLFAVIRGKNVYNLGKVERLYLEPCGAFSLYSFEAERPGLSVLPEPEEEEGPVHAISGVLKACCDCGYAQMLPDANKACENCGRHNWVKAVI